MGRSMKAIALRGSAKECLIDDQDEPFLRQWSWQLQSASGRFYAKRSTEICGKPVTLMMHRVIMDAPKGMVVDHIDGNGLNNCRANLRIVTQAQNLWNRRDRPLGVCWDGHRLKWRATINHLGKKFEVGFYEDQDRAIAARAYVASVLRSGIAPSADEIDRLTLPPTIRRLILPAPPSEGTG
jgi:hypothetical protein